MTDYIVATTKPWNIHTYYNNASKLSGSWYLVTTQNDLNLIMELIEPRYIFFPHWSWKVPNSILESAECVCFHMTDVPYGRGGSPLQNLITRGHQKTKLTALRMVEEMDAGPIYLKRDLDLSGRAQDIFERASEIICSMMEFITRNEPVPESQKGTPTAFTRRTPEMSQLPQEGNIQNCYDHIRMLDADTYPLAFIEYGRFRLTFSHAELDSGDGLTARVHIALHKEEV